MKISSFRETEQFGKNIGVSLSGKALRKANYQYLVEQVESKLASGKTNILSFVGRVTLAKSVIEVIPTYTMMTNAMQVTYIDEIQRLQCNFIWSDTTDKKKMHIVKWDTLTKPNPSGG